MACKGHTDKQTQSLTHALIHTLFVKIKYPEYGGRKNDKHEQIVKDRHVRFIIDWQEVVQIDTNCGDGHKDYQKVLSYSIFKMQSHTKTCNYG